MPSEDERKPRASIVAKEFESDSLVGSFFHSDVERGWQGFVVAEPAPTVYLVELFSWVSGDTTDQRLVRLEEMIEGGWVFYDTSEQMNFAYERRVDGRWERERGDQG